MLSKKIPGGNGAAVPCLLVDGEQFEELYRVLPEAERKELAKCLAIRPAEVGAGSPRTGAGAEPASDTAAEAGPGAPRTCAGAEPASDTAAEAEAGPGAPRTGAGAEPAGAESDSAEPAAATAAAPQAEVAAVAPIKAPGAGAPEPTVAADGTVANRLEVAAVGGAAVKSVTDIHAAAAAAAGGDGDDGEAEMVAGVEQHAQARPNDGLLVSFPFSFRALARGCLC